MKYKNVNIPFPLDLYNQVKQAADKDSRSMAGWIKLTLEREATKQLKK